MAITRLYPTTTTQSIGVATATSEVLASETAPSSGTWSGSIAKRGSENFMAAISPVDAFSGTYWAEKYYYVSVDASSLPAGLQLAVSTIDRSDSTGVNNRGTGTITWDTDTGTGVHTGTGSFIDPNSNASIASGDRLVSEFIIDNNDNKNTLGYVIDAGADTWFEQPGIGYPPLHFVCGAECQMSQAGAASGWLEHWHTNADDRMTASTTYARNGSYSWEFNTLASSTSRVISRIETASSKVYFRYYIYMPDLSQSMWITQSNQGTGRIVVEKSGTTLRAFIRGDDGSTYTYTSTNNVTLQANTWYGVEYTADTSGTTWTLDWRTWDAANGWTSNEQITQGSNAAATGTLHLFGFCTLASASNWKLYMDDIAFQCADFADQLYDTTGTNGVDGAVLRYSPSSDGTHNFSAADDFLENGTTNLGTGATDAYTFVDAANMDQTTTYLEQNNASTTEYVEVNLEDESNNTDPRGVSILLTGSATGTEDGEVRISDDNFTNEVTAVTIENFSGGVGYYSSSVQFPPGGGVWSQSAINNLKFRLGYSAASNQQFYSTAAEVEWTTISSGSEDYSGTASASHTSAASASGVAYEWDAYDAEVMSETGIEAYLPLSESTGTAVYDIAGGTYHGALNGGYTLGQGGIPGGGDSVRLTLASNGYILLDGSPQVGNGPWTLEIWVKRASINNSLNEALWGNDTDGPAGFAFTDQNWTGDGGNAEPNEIISWNTGGGYGPWSDSAITETTNWHHIVLAADNGTEWNMYIDGTLTASSPDRPGDTTINAGNRVIGNNFSGFTRPFDGWVTKAAIYSTELSQAQVTSHYEIGANVKSGTASASHTSSATASGGKTISATTSVSNTSATTASGNALESAEGTASASHSSSITIAGERAQSGSVTTSNASAATIAGTHAATGSATDSAASAATAAGTKAGQGTISASAASSETTAGTKDTSGTATDSFASGITITGDALEERSGTASASHASGVTVSGQRAHSVTITESYTSATTATGARGSEDYSGTTSTSNTSSVTASGTKSVQSSATTSSISSEAVTGLSGRSQTITESAASSITASGAKIETFSGTASTSHSSAATASGQSGRLYAATASSTSSTTATGDKLEIRSGTASASHTANIVVTGIRHQDAAVTQSHTSSITAVGEKARLATLQLSYTPLTTATGSKTSEQAYLRPASDVQTTGWTTAPLWSKIDEDSPDGVVISGTTS